MQQAMTAEILGMSFFKGEVEGTNYDSTKVFIKLELSGNGKGFAAQDYKFGDSSEFKKYEHLPFPFMADVVIKFTTNGKTMKQELVSLVPKEIKKAA